MSKKEENKQNAEKTLRELKDWEVRQKQFLDDFQVMEDYLEALSKKLKGQPEEPKDGE